MNGHEILHKILYLHRVIRETLSDIPATEEFKELREAGLELKSVIEHKVIVNPDSILNA